MAHTKVTKTYSQNTGVANTFSYSGSFDVFKGTEVTALLDNVALTYTATTINDSASPREYTVDTAAKTIHIGGADLSSGTIVIRPETDLGSPTPRAEYAPGSSITAADLNNNNLQLLRRAMEYEEQVLFKTGGTLTGDLEMGKDQNIVFEGATENAHETTLTVTDPTADRTITFPNVTGNVVTTGDTATVTATMMAANSVDSSELVDGSIDTSHIGNLQVTTAKIANDNITNAKIADDAIDSEHYTDGSIDTVHIADANITTAKLADNAATTAKIADGNVTTAKIATDAVDGTKIADNSIDSAHYVDGSIDLTHMSANSVSSAQYVDGSIDLVHMSANSVDSDQYVDGSIDRVHLEADIIDSTKLADNAVQTEHITDGHVTLPKLTAQTSGNILVGDGSNRAESVAMSGDVAIAAGGATTIQANSVEIGMIGCEQTTISDSDSHIPTSGAVVDYVAAQLAPIGGLEVIADDESFPNTIPAAGVVISISDAAGLTVNSSGVSTNADTLDNSTVTINGFPSELRGGVGSNADPYVFQSGAGLMVQSTGSSHTYNYHQALIRESDFVQLSDDINDFNNRYRIHNGEPSSNNDDGDLVWDTNANKMKVYNSTSSAWEEVSSVGEYKFIGIKDNGQAHNGTGPTFNGSNDQYDLFDGTSDADVTSAAQLLVVLNGVLQKPNDGTFSGSEEGFYLDGADGIRFCDPPPSGSTLFVTQIGSATTVNVPADNSVSAVKIQSGAVTTAKIGADAVDGTKIADNAIDSEHYTDGSIDHVHLAGDCVDGDNIGDDVVNSEHIAAGAVDLEHMSSESVDEDNLKISNAGSNGQFLQKQTGNTGGLTWADASVGGASGTDYNDSVKARFGTGNDLEIYHDGTHSHIRDTGTGDLRLRSDKLQLMNENSEEYLVGTSNGAVELYYDDFKSFRTHENGIVLYGPEGGDGHLIMYADEGDDNADFWRLTAGADGNWVLYNYADGAYEKSIQATGAGNVELYYDNAKKFETTSGGATATGQLNFAAAADPNISIRDSGTIAFGNGDDLKILHDGSHSYIKNTTGNISIEAKAGESSIKCVPDGGVELYYNDTKTCYTSNGCLSFPDDQKIFMGGDNDLQIYHDGTDSHIDNNTSDLRINSNDIQLRDSSENFYIDCNNGGSVDLYHNGSKKIETTSAGVDITGKLTFDADSDTFLYRSGTNTLQVHTNDTLCTSFEANQRVKMPQVYSTAGSSMRDVQVESDGTLCGQSSIRAAKKNITPLSDISWLYNLNPVTFNYRKHTVDPVTGVNTYLDDAVAETSYGLIAEEVETVKKDFCFYNKDESDNDVLSGVLYKQLIAPLLKALQDQKKEIDTLKTKVAALEAK